MKLKTLSESISPVQGGLDLDVANRLGPTVLKHIVSLETLSKLLPNTAEICAKLEELKHAFETSVSLQSNVLEKNALDAINLTLEQQLHSPVHPAVKDLENELKSVGKTGKSIHNSQISSMVKKIAEKNRVSVNDLNKMFMASHGNSTPYHYMELARNGQIKEATTAQLTIDDHVANSFVIEMYETMKPGLGDKAWVAISKRLKAQGYEPAMVENIINRAIVEVSKRK